MTNADGNAGETPPSGAAPSEPSSGGYEAPSIEQSQDRPQSGPAQPSYEFAPLDGQVSDPYPPAVDYPADFPQDYPPPPGYLPSFGADPGYPPPPPGFPPPGFPPPPGYPPPPGFGMPGPYPVGYHTAPGAVTNNLAIGSLVASILSLPLLFMCALGLLAAFVGVGLGIAALGQIKQRGEQGHGLAVAGIVVGAIGIVLNGGWLLLFVAALFAA
ncbi:DUF4190 domain-containing protein [Mycobacterium sp. TNTM28]|uniref:DUF4190 domain-containing protein n=1 Tax=[Mycobacterium] fortunisiensis TaxID=2600579 RepID=A0ABS6KRG0_9MYCO|nr:DUF4190 domain-containing protein [[Mycobacterium] fortunisiensis]MBU9766233.1 DUF4190 domain-containing protein [[Mycobacterium] fortunisiensis]